MFKDIYPGDGSFPGDFTRLGKHLYFSASDPDHGWELWRTDGTRQKTKLVADIYPNEPGSEATSLEAFKNKLYFMAFDGTPVGFELWRSDGTANGTDLAVNLRPESGQSSTPAELTRLGKNTLLLTANVDDDYGIELYRTNGTPQGTSLVKDIYEGPGQSQPLHLTRFGDRLVFAANDGINGIEPWITNGKPGGTKVLKDINEGDDDSYSYACGFTKLGKRLLFGAGNEETGNELWKTDGTTAGTKLVKHIRPGAAPADPFGCD
jgi:ELWxxDGT repeat protein